MHGLNVYSIFVANYDHCNLAELGGFSPQYDMQYDNTYGRAALSQFTCSCFPSTDPGMLIPRVRRPNRAYCALIPNPNSLACTGTPLGPFRY